MNRVLCRVGVHGWRTVDRRYRAITEYRTQACVRCGSVRRQGRGLFFGWFSVAGAEYPDERSR